VAFPKKLLNPNEQLHVDLRPHWWYLAKTVFMLFASIALLVALRWVLGWNDGAEGVLTLGSGVLVVVALAWFVVRYLKWMTTNFAVTNHRVIFRQGIIAKKGIEIPLDRVNTIFFNQGIFERMIGAGDLTIESAGERGAEHFSDIRKPSQVQNQIYRLIEEEQDEHAGMGRDLSVPEQIEKLDDLRKKGIISEEEFAKKKASLLERM
jgi:uncharacterized membrane protein YdbT with pleckstrin-like domain